MDYKQREAMAVEMSGEWIALMMVGMGLSREEATARWRNIIGDPTRPTFKVLHAFLSERPVLVGEVAQPAGKHAMVRWYNTETSVLAQPTGTKLYVMPESPRRTPTTSRTARRRR